MCDPWPSSWPPSWPAAWAPRRTSDQKPRPDDLWADWFKDAAWNTECTYCRVLQNGTCDVLSVERHWGDGQSVLKLPVIERDVGHGLYPGQQWIEP